MTRILDFKMTQSVCHTSHLPLWSVRVFPITGPNHFVESTVHSFAVNLPEVLAAMVLDDRSLVCIAEFPNGRYIQFRVAPGATIAEVVSNQFLNGDNALSEEDQKLLGAVGFNEPSPSQYPNWRHVATDPKCIAETIRVANAAIISAMHASPNETVRIRTFEVLGQF